MSAPKPLPPPRQPMYRDGDLVRHVATGAVYVIKLAPRGYKRGRRLRDERTAEEVYEYTAAADQHERDRTSWIRSQSEMEDGRFVKVTP